MKTTTKLLAILGIAGLAGLFNTTCQAADAVQTKINPKDGAEMVFVPAGPFKMGMDPIPMDQEQREQLNTPKHEVTLDGYWIYKYPVTVKQYKAYLEANKDRKPLQHFTGKMPAEPLWGWQDNHPMVNVTAAQAADYAKWAGAALPTEAQWEKAARGTDGRLYPWGNDWDPDACVHSSKVFCDAKGTRPVGSCPKNVSPYGAMDMAGNVWQFCDDMFRKDWYSRAEKTNPVGPPPYLTVKTEKHPEGVRDGSNGRVTRGGSWALCAPKVFQTVDRDFCTGDMAYAGMDTGFRCVVAESTSGNSAKTLPSGTLVEAIATPSPEPVHVTATFPATPTSAGKGAETEYIYTGDFQTGEIHKINTADGSYECFIKGRDGKGGTGGGCEFDSHGNLFSIHGGYVVKITPDKTVTVVVTGLGNGFDMTVDSNDNLILGDYTYASTPKGAVAVGKLFKVEAKNLVPEKLPIKIEYEKDAAGKWNFDKCTFTPEGSVTELDNTYPPYGMSYDRNGNVYVQRLCGPFFKYDAAGKKTQMCERALTYWQRTPIMDAHGDFYVFGFDILKVTPDGRAIARMAPGHGFVHAVGIVIDSKGNLWQADPHKDGNLGLLYKYTPDGQRSLVRDHVGQSPFWIAIWPRAKFPVTEPAK